MMDRHELIRKIIELQHKSGHAMRHHASAEWMDLSLTIGQLKSLFYIDREESINFRKLAAALEVTPPNITGIVDRLVEHGLVSRKENPEDRRVLLLRTTDKGKTLLAKLRGSSTSRMSGILSGLTDEELSALAKGLEAIARETERNKEKTVN